MKPITDVQKMTMKYPKFFKFSNTVPKMRCFTGSPDPAVHYTEFPFHTIGCKGPLLCIFWKQIYYKQINVPDLLFNPPMPGSEAQRCTRVTPVPKAVVIQGESKTGKLGDQYSMSYGMMRGRGGREGC